MKEINIYTSSKCLSNLEEKPATYVIKMEYKGTKKYIDDFMLCSTSYRAIIMSIVEAVKHLKEPCKINIYNPCSVGLKKILDKKGNYKTTSSKYNGDLLNELSELLSSRGHAIKEHISNNHLKELNMYHKKYDELFKEYKNRNNINTGQSSNWNVKSRDNGVSPF